MTALRPNDSLTFTFSQMAYQTEQLSFNKFFDSIIPSLKNQNGSQGASKWPTGSGKGFTICYWQGCKKYVLSKILKFFVIECLNPPLAGCRINYANILSHFTIHYSVGIVDKMWSIFPNIC